MRIATWNVNGIRARNAQVIDWIARDRPDVVCLQEIKAKPDQLPPMLFEPEGYWCHWHGAGGYSGVALFVSKEIAPLPPAFDHPPFDFETRVATVVVDGTLVASVYVPNGGKDYAGQDEVSRGPGRVVVRWSRAGRALVMCGDLNVAHTDRDLHPEGAEGGAIGQRPDERAVFDRLLARRPGRRRTIAQSRERGDVLVVGAVAEHAPAQHRLAHRLRAGQPRPGRRAPLAARSWRKSAPATTRRSIADF